MTNCNEYAPLIKACYHAFELGCDERTEKIQCRYCHKLDREMPHAVQDMLQEVSDVIPWRTLEVTDAPIEEFFMQMTRDIQTEYLSHGA